MTELRRKRILWSLQKHRFGKEIDLFKTGGGERAALQLGVPFLGRVPFDHQIVEGADFGITFVRKYPDSEAAKAFTQIVAEVINFVSEEDSK
ncbi:P-loop NTPase [bacterium]|nr:P-loop NTPase [bacterium]